LINITLYYVKSIIKVIIYYLFSLGSTNRNKFAMGGAFGTEGIGKYISEKTGMKGNI